MSSSNAQGVLKVAIGIVAVSFAEITFPANYATAQPTSDKPMLVHDNSARSTAHSPDRLPGPDRLPTSYHFDLADANYFLAGFAKGIKTGARPDMEYSNQVKFRVAIRYRLNKGGKREALGGVYATYVQNSLWHVYDDSAPFYDNNYSPGLLGVVPLGGRLATLVGINHESTGRRGDLSRGWNRIPVGVLLGRQGISRWWVDARYWTAFGVEESNSDIRDFSGVAEIRSGLNSLSNAFAWRVDARARINEELQGTNLEVNGAVDIPVVNKWFSAQAHAQYFTGYSESLLTYNRKTHSVRLGLSLLQ